MKDPNNPCLFCNVKKSGCAHENELAYACLLYTSDAADD